MYLTKRRDIAFALVLLMLGIGVVGLCTALTVVLISNMYNGSIIVTGTAIAVSDTLVGFLIGYWAARLRRPPCDFCETIVVPDQIAA